MTTITITFDMTQAERSRCSAALQHDRKPRRWRASEYAMTKATAAHAVESFVKHGSAPLFDALCLSSELARYIKYGNGNPDVFYRLQEAISQNPEAVQMLAQSQAYERAMAKVKQLQRRAEKLTAAAASLSKSLSR